MLTDAQVIRHFTERYQAVFKTVPLSLQGSTPSKTTGVWAELWMTLSDGTEYGGIGGDWINAYGAAKLTFHFPPTASLLSRLDYQEIAAVAFGPTWNVAHIFMQPVLLDPDRPINQSKPGDTLTDLILIFPFRYNKRYITSVNDLSPATVQALGADNISSLLR